MTNRSLLLVLVTWLACYSTASAVEWQEVLVTTSDARPLAVGKRQVLAYFGAGAGLLMAGDKKVPLGSYECAGVVDSGPDGVSLNLDCVITDPGNDEVYLKVAREKSDTFASGAGVYQYVGGTGAWEGFTADCTYQVTYMPSKVHGVEIATCNGELMPPPLR